MLAVAHCAICHTHAPGGLAQNREMRLAAVALTEVVPISTRIVSDRNGAVGLVVGPHLCLVCEGNVFACSEQRISRVF